MIRAVSKKVWPGSVGRRLPPHPDLLPPGEGTAAAAFLKDRQLFKRFAVSVMPKSRERGPLSQRERAGVRENLTRYETATETIEPL